MDKLNLEPKDDDVLDFCFDLMSIEFGVSNSKARLIFKELKGYDKRGQKYFLSRRYQKRIKQAFDINIYESAFCSFREKTNTLFVELWGIYDENEDDFPHITAHLSANTRDEEEHKKIFESYLREKKVYLVDNVFNYLYYSIENDESILRIIENRTMGG